MKPNINYKIDYKFNNIRFNKIANKNTKNIILTNVDN